MRVYVFDTNGASRMTKNRLLFLAKIAISAGLIWFLFGKIDLGAAADRALSAEPLYMAVGCLLLGVQMGIGGGRWWCVMRTMKSPLNIFEAVRLFWIGNFFSQVLPSSVGGDPVRVYLAYKDGMALRVAINSVLLERIVALVSLVVLVVIVQPWFLPNLNDQDQRTVLMSLGILVASTAIGLAVLTNVDRLPARWRQYRVAHAMVNLASDTRRVFFSRKHTASILIVGVMSQINLSLVVYFLGLSLQVPASLIDYLVIMPVVVLVTTIPISIAGWGVRESAMVAALALVGVPGDGAFVLSILVGIMTVVAMMPGGMLWVLGRGRGERVSASEASDFVEAALLHDTPNAKPKGDTPLGS